MQQLDKKSRAECGDRGSEGESSYSLIAYGRILYCELIVNNCYFEGTDSPIYTQANISVTNSEFNFSNGWANICLNGCGNNGGKFIFTNNKISGNQFSCLYPDRQQKEIKKSAVSKRYRALLLYLAL